jgi:DNA-binding transcriptional LysR family regulator
MELRQLATFKIVASTLSFTRAAIILNYAQSSVTAQIQALEEELSIPLFHRLGRQVTLTDAGRRLLEYAEKMLELSEEARSIISGEDEPGGTLEIGSSETVCTYLLMPVLREFRARYPNVRLTFRPIPYAQLIPSVKDGSVDVSFVLEENVQASGLLAEVLTCESLVLVAAPEHRLARAPVVTTADLENETILFTEKGCCYRAMFEQALSSCGVTPQASIEFHSVEAMKKCAIAGLGITILPEIAAQRELATGELYQLRWNEPDLHVYTHMVWHKDRWLSPALKAFLEVSRETLTQQTAFS